MSIVKIRDQEGNIVEIPVLRIPEMGGNDGSSDIVGGVFKDEIKANADKQTPTTYLLRNSALSPTDLTVENNGEIAWLYG